jgi:hypothetical protein
MNRTEGQWEQPEFSVPVHRGLNSPSLDTSKGTGVHWSTDKHIAHNLAGLHRFNTREEAFNPTTTTVVHGEIPFGSVETDKPTLRRLDVLGVDEPKEATEFEVTAKKGSPVRVHGVTKTVQSPRRSRETGEDVPVTTRSRTRRYNPAREMKA